MLFRSGLSHAAQHRVGDVLRGDLQLTGDVVADQLPKEGVLPVRKKIVEADAAADKDLLHPGNGSEFPQQRHIVAVVGVHVLAGGGIQALPPAAGALTELLLAGRMAEIGGM